MLQTDIAILEQRQKALEKEIGEALSHAPVDDPMIATSNREFYSSRAKLIVFVTKLNLPALVAAAFSFSIVWRSCW